MSKKSIHTIKCNHCSKEFTRELADSYNTQLDKDAIKNVINCDDFLLECPYCNKKTNYQHSLTFNNVEKNIMIQYATSLEEAYNIIQQYERLQSKYQLDNKLRVVVFSEIRFFEKVSIISAGYNDIVMELYKCVVAEDNKIDPENVYIMFSEDLNEKCVLATFDDDSEQNFAFNEIMYNYLYEALKTKEYFDRPNDYFVDSHFMNKIYLDESDCEPLHMEVFRHREYIAFVNINGFKNPVLCLMPDECDSPNVKVLMDGIIYDGTIVNVLLLSEHKLGRSFDSLPKIVID